MFFEKTHLQFSSFLVYHRKIPILLISCKIFDVQSLYSNYDDDDDEEYNEEYDDDDHDYDDDDDAISDVEWWWCDSVSGVSAAPPVIKLRSSGCF